MRGAVWITHPVQMVLGETELAERPIPVHAHTFQLVDHMGVVAVSGLHTLRADEDEVAHELFRSVLFMLPEDQDSVNRGQLCLRVNGRTYTQGPCQTTAYIPDEVLYRHTHGILS